MADVQVDPVQSTILAAFLSFVIKFMFDVKKMMETKKEEVEKRLENLADATAKSFHVIAENMVRMEERTRWMIRHSPPTPSGPYEERENTGTFKKQYTPRPRAEPRDSHWTPVEGVEIIEKSRRHRTGEDDKR